MIATAAELKVGVGKLRAVVGGETRAQKIGGEPPEWIQIFPDGEYACDDGTYICDADCRKAIIAHFNERGNDLVVDYEHQTLSDEKAPAAGWIVELADRGAAGLWGRVQWTEEAKGYLRSGEYRYDSPVYDYDVKTRRIAVLHHLALTNWPGSNNRTPLTEQMAASVRARRTTKQKREGVMDELMERLLYFLNLPLTATADNVLAELKKLEAAITPGTGMLLASEKHAGRKTIAELVAQKTAITDLVAAQPLLDELELPATASVAQAHAKIGEMKTAAGEVEQLRAELKTAKEKLAAAEVKTDEDKLTILIQQNRKKVPPAKEAWLRQVARKHGIEHATEVVKNWAEVLPDATAAEAAGAESPVAVANQTVRIGARDVPVDADSALRLERARAIQKENPDKYPDLRTAAAELARREAAAK
jgi:phage I-like protein